MNPKVEKALNDYGAMIALSFKLLRLRTEILRNTRNFTPVEMEEFLERSKKLDEKHGTDSIVP